MQGKTFTAVVDEVGTFECYLRNTWVQAKIDSVINRLSDGADQISDAFALECKVLAYLQVVIKTAPDGWDLDGADPDSEEDQRRIWQTYVSIRAAEDTFRGKSRVNTQAAGEGT